MTALEGVLTRDAAEVVDFLYLEARLADEHDYDAWEALWTDDAVYWVPLGYEANDPDSHMSLVYDNRRRIATRIKQLKTGRPTQTPPSHLRRVISNVELLSTLGGEWEVAANFVAVESRELGTTLWAGRTTYRVRLVDGELRLAYKRVELVDRDRALSTLSFII